MFIKRHYFVQESFILSIFPFLFWNKTMNAWIFTYSTFKNQSLKPISLNFILTYPKRGQWELPWAGYAVILSWPH